MSDSNKNKCPDCGKTMARQFHGLWHCDCGMSWKKYIGYLKRTSGMEFVLERRTVGSKTKQVPGIRY